MNQTMQFRQSVSTLAGDSAAEVCVFEITKEAAIEIVGLSELVKQHKLHKVEKFDYRASFLIADPEGEDYDADGEDELDDAENKLGTECDSLNVSNDDFYFTAYVKGSDITVMSEAVPVTKIVAFFNI